MDEQQDAPIVPEHDARQPDLADAIRVTPRMIVALRGSRPWVLFLSICTFAIAGLSGLVMLVLMINTAAGSQSRPEAIGTAIGSGLVSMIFVGAYAVAGFRLFRYARSIRIFCLSHETEYLEQAFEAQRAAWRWLGILAVVLVGFYGLAVLGYLVFGLLSGGP